MLTAIPREYLLGEDPKRKPDFAAINGCISSLRGKSITHMSNKELVDTAYDIILLESLMGEDLAVC